MALSGQAKNVLKFLMNFKTNQIKINQNKKLRQERKARVGFRKMLLKTES